VYEEELKELGCVDLHVPTPPEERRAAIYARMRARAREAPEQLARWSLTLDPYDARGSLQLAEVYEALAPDAGVLQEFFVGQLDRLLRACEARPRSREAFSALDALAFVEERSEALSAAMRRRLLEALPSPAASVRRAAVDLLGGHDVASDARARAALMASLRDPDWKVRALSESSLSPLGLLPTDYEVPVTDRLRRRFRNWTSYV
jgi:hypothetical protein